MKTKLKYIIAIMLVVSIVITGFFIWRKKHVENTFKEFYSYIVGDKHKYKGIEISYNDKTILRNGDTVHFFTRFSGFFTKRLYYKEIDKNTECLTLSIKDYGTLKFYRYDKDNILLSLQKNNCSEEKYILKAKYEFEDSFDQLIDALYEDTENEMFLK